MEQILPHLMRPITIGTLTLANRAVMPAMGTGYGNKDGTVSDRLVAYLARRAAGGVGMVITEECAVDPRGRNMAREIGVWDDAFIPGLARLAAAVKGQGSAAVLQLHHAGRETMEAVIGTRPEAPSALPSVIYGQACEEMTPSRIAAVVAAYGDAARRARDAGFDAVEIHGAHGYLVHQFLSPFSNHRSDEYGGTPEKRARFLMEVVAAVRQRAGADFPVIVRLSAEECIRGGFDISFTRWLAPRLAAAGVQALHGSVGVYSTPGLLSIAAADTPAGFNLERARELRAAAGIPVIGVGRITDPRMADEAIARGDADLVAMGRQLLADPETLSKARAGAWDDIRWCLGCNQGCIDRLSFEFKSVTCSINPECGAEHEDRYGSVAAGRRVWIVGGGPAGIAAALAARRRGHAVTLFERDAELGGQLLPASRPPHKEGFARWVHWGDRALAAAGVTVRRRETVTAALLAAERPEALVLATGAAPFIPAIPGGDAGTMVEARALLVGRVAPAGPAIILGGGYVGMETADFLTARGCAVTVIEMAPQAPVSPLTAHGYWLHRRLKQGGGTLLLGTRVLSVGEGFVTVEQDGAQRRLGPAAMIVAAFGAAPERDLEETLRTLDIPVQWVGDAIAPRRLLEAVHEGDAAGRAL